VHFDQENVQDQQRLVWPASFVVARAYLDQLERGHGLADAKVASARSTLARAERQSGRSRAKTLTKLAGQLDKDAAGAGDRAKVTTLAAAVRALASGT